MDDQCLYTGIDGMAIIYTLNDFSLSHCIKLDNTDTQILSGIKKDDTLYLSKGLFVYAIKINSGNRFVEPILGKYSIRKGVNKMFLDDKYVLFG